MRNRIRTALAAGLMLGCAALAQTLPQGVQKVTSVEGVTEYALPNGLHVLLFPDTSKPKVTVNMTYLVGSRHEGYGETGMAHLLEHMLFKTTKSGRDVKKELSDHGAEFNGTTSYDRTNYFEVVPANDDNLKWAIGLEAERMVGMRIEKSILDTEMTVVRNEFEMGENSPSRILEQRVLSAAYVFHNYGKSTIGSRSDIEHVPIDRLAAFYQKYYQPDDAMLTIAGNFDEPKALALVAAAFGGIPRPTRKLEQTYTVEPTQDGERSVTLRRVGDSQEIRVAYHGPSGAHQDGAALDVLSEILAEPPAGRLYKALVTNKKAVGVSAEFQSMHDPGFLMVTVRLRPDQSIDEARDIILKTVEGVASEPPTKDEVERAKSRLLKGFELEMTNSESVGLMFSESAAIGDWRLLYLSRDQTKAITPEDIQRVAKAYLKPSNRTLGEFIPTKDPDRAEIPLTPDITALLKDYKGGAAVAQGESFDLTPANIESRLTRVKLPNGMKLVMLPKKNRGGTVIATLQGRFGDEKSLFGKVTAASMTGALLMRGTKNKTRQQIQDETDRLKAHVGVSGGPNFAGASIETTEANLAGALRLAAECLMEPTFPETEFEQVRQQRIAQVETNKSDPQNLAFIEYQRHLNASYPRGDVHYTPTPDEQIEDLKKVTLAEAKKFYQDFYGGGTGEIVVVGQFNKDEIQKVVTELFGNWKTPVPAQRILNPYKKVAPENQKIETPDKQNAVFLATVSFPFSDEEPDYPALAMASYIFGGTPASRLWQSIREKQGLSYMVQSMVSVPTKDTGANMMGIAISAPQNAPKVEASFKEELARVLKDGFTKEEVDAAKKAFLDERKVGRSEDGQLA